MKTPAKQGHYVSYWRLHNPTSDKKFGQRVWVMINVVCDSSSSSSGDEKDDRKLLSNMELLYVIYTKWVLLILSAMSSTS